MSPLLRVVLASDHAGFEYRQRLAADLREKGFPVSVVEAGGRDANDDYPDVASRLAEEILSGRAKRGILICGSGIGVNVAANKHPGIRAGVCHDAYTAHQAVEHDDMNVLCLGQRVIGYELARELSLTFLSAVFSNEERHRRRLEKIRAIEHRYGRKVRDESSIEADRLRSKLLDGQPDPREDPKRGTEATR